MATRPSHSAGRPRRFQDDRPETQFRPKVKSRCDVDGPPLTMLYPLRLDNDEQETWEVSSQEVSNSSRSNNARRICVPTWTIIVRPPALSRAVTKTISKRLESNTTAGVKSIRRKRLMIRKVDLQQLQQIVWMNTACHE